MIDHPIGAWKIDARDRVSGGAGVFVPDDRASEFISDSHKRIIVGAKGMGKSLLLQRKYLHLTSTLVDKTSHLFLPRNSTERVELMDRMAFYTEHDTKRDLVQTHLSQDWWQLIWTASISTVAVFHACDRFFFSDVWNLLGLGDFRRIALEDRSDLYVHTVLRTLLASHLSSGQLVTIISQLKPGLANLTKTVVISIDNADEAFTQNVDTHALSRRQRDAADPSSPQHGKALDEDYSLLAQVGLLAAIWALHANPKLHVYASLRIEAIDKRIADRNPLWQQERSLCVEISCSKDLAEKIFIANIAATADEKCTAPAEENPYRRFVGFDSMPFNASETIIESLFDYFYRHTLGRPRDLMEIGGRICALPPKSRDRDAIKKITENCVGLTLKFYESAMLPSWDRRWDAALGEFDCNVFSSGEMLRVSQRITKIHGIKDPISYLVDRGLVGTISQNHNTGEKRMKFRQISRYIRGRVIEANHSSYYFLHPVIYGAASNANAAFRVDASIRVGYDCPFIRSLETNRLLVDGFIGEGLNFEYDGRPILRLRSETSITGPIFAAIACAAWRLKDPIVPFEEFKSDLLDILNAGICQVGLHNRSLKDVASDWQAGNKAMILDIDDAVADVNWILRKHLRMPDVDPDLPSNEQTLVAWDGTTFHLHLCPASHIEGGRLSEEVRRVFGRQ